MVLVSLDFGQGFQLPEEGTLATGRVKWFSETKGFGFIEDGGGREVYVHYTAIDATGAKTLPDGAIVHYEIIETQQGPEAANVRIQERI